MSCRFVLLTNNPRYEGRDELPVDYRAGAAGIEIVRAGRDLIHLGWTLLNHPLYGNFRPNQQPYRTLLLSKDDKAAFDEYGLRLIEEAMGVYTACVKPLTPQLTPERMRRDCAVIDEELLKETLLKSGLVR